MNSRATPVLLLLVMVAGAVVTASTTAVAAGARVYTVQVDATPPVGEPWAYLRFFPGPAIQVHRGDTVNFAWAGADTPHTATVVPSADANAWRSINQGPGGPYQSPIPDSVVGGDDAELVENPAEVFPSDPTCGSGANPCSFDGSSVVSSGFRFSAPGAQPSFDVRVDAPAGTYSFLCLLHPGMQSRLRVVPASTWVPGPAAVADRIRDQVRRVTRVDGALADAQAQAVNTVPLADGATRYVMSAGGFSNGLSANEFSDTPIRVNVGDRVQFHGTQEIHTATFPAASASKVPFITSQCEVPGPDIPAASPFDCADPSMFQLALNTRAIAPTVNVGLRPHRFVNSGLLVGPVQHTFIARVPGTYRFICLVHGPQMQSTVVVT